MNHSKFLKHFHRAKKSHRKNQFEQNKYLDVITGRQLDPVTVIAQKLLDEVTIVKKGGWSVIFPEGTQVKNTYEYRLFPNGKSYKVDVAEVLDVHGQRHRRRFVNGVMTDG